MRLRITGVVQDLETGEREAVRLTYGLGEGGVSEVDVFVRGQHYRDRVTGCSAPLTAFMHAVVFGASGGGVDLGQPVRDPVNIDGSPRNALVDRRNRARRSVSCGGESEIGV